MCVIMIVSKNRPSEKMVAGAYKTNDHGAGIAWREKAGDGKTPIVRWKKGLKEDEMQKLCKDLPLPYIAHFRIASCGGQNPLLCHPFPVSKEVDLALEGQTKGYVLFHNGHWGEWKFFCRETALKTGNKIPNGPWSDSRAMAWAAHNFGIGILEMIDEKSVAFGPSDIEVMRGTGWEEVDGVWCSNKSFTFGTYNQTHQRGGGRDASFFGRGHDADSHARDDYFTRPPHSMAGGDASKKLEVPGGDLDKLPFVEIDKIWTAQQTIPRVEWKLSKKQYKRLKRKYEKELDRLHWNQNQNRKPSPAGPTLH